MSTAPSAVNPASIPEQMSREQLQWWILFTIAVAGKNAKVTEKKMRAFMDLNGAITPFGKVLSMLQYSELGRNLRKVKLGKYTLLGKGFRAAIKLDLNALADASPSIALSMLMSIPGIGPKGARMILMYAFPKYADMYVPLDTHILHWLRDQEYLAPRATPTGDMYLFWEDVFRREARQREMTMRDLDTKIWLEYSKNGNANQVRS